MAKPQNLLFDLDGTLADPYDAFSSSVIYALTKNSYPVPSEAIIKSCIGPPLQESLVQILGVPSSEMPKLLQDYREHHEREALFQYKFFPDARPFLEKAQARFQLYVATSKPWYLAEPILQKQKMHQYFKRIYGAEKNGVRSNKGELIEFLLQEEGLEKFTTVMIGDRKHDVIGAHKNGIPCYGVEWGFALLNELKEAKAERIINSWKELEDYLLN